VLADPAAPDPLSVTLETSRRAEVAALLATLTGRESGILRLRFGFVDGRSHTYDEIGLAYGVSSQRIRQIEASTVTKLRHPARSGILRDLLD
jgi:RNA polymerase primary sigma factor